MPYSFIHVVTNISPYVFPVYRWLELEVQFDSGLFFFWKAYFMGGSVCISYYPNWKLPRHLKREQDEKMFSIKYQDSLQSYGN